MLWPAGVGTITGGHDGYRFSLRQPPSTRSRAASARVEEAGDESFNMDAIVERVMARLLQSGLAVSAAAAPATSTAEAAAVSGSVGPAAEAARPTAVKAEVKWDEEVGVPSLACQRLWLDELKRQLGTSLHFGVREREEARGLLIIGEADGPPLEHRAWYWGRVRLFLIVAHHSWTAAVRDSGGSEFDRLGIYLSPAATPAPPAARPVAPSPAGWRGRPSRPVAPSPAEWRGRPSRPSGLRPPPGAAASAAALRRKN